MTGTVFLPPRFRLTDSSGVPIPGARLTFYQAGSTTLALVYTDSALTVPHTNPVVSDAAGEFRPIYTDPDAGFDYRVVATDANGVQLWAEDNVPAAGGGTGSGGGTPGPAGPVSAEVYIYQRSDTAPPTPTGGSYNFATLTLTPPAGWTREVPAGNAPAYQCATVAAANSPTGTDVLLAWSAPVRVFSDGQGTNVIFRRNAGLPATPAPSVGIPAGWYDSNTLVPASADTLWASNGSRPYEGANWIWGLCYQIEGDAGPPGESGVLWYIKPLAGTAIKNGTGTLSVELHLLSGGVDTAVTSGPVMLYVGNTLVNVANGYATGSNGYAGFFDAGDIAGAVTVTAKDIAIGVALDTITLVDVADGTADTGKNAVYGYIDASNGLAFTRLSDGTTWSPTANTTRLDCTFVQGGAEVARVAWLVTRDNATGLLTGATTTHGGGDLNGSRVTVTELHEGSQAFTVTFAYSFGGDVTSTAETVLTSMAGLDGGDSTVPGPGAIQITVTKPTIPVMAYQNGTVVSYASANGQLTVWDGNTDVTASATINAVSAVNCVGTCNTALNTPVTGAKGYYAVSAITADTASLTLSATYNAVTVTYAVTLSKSYVGYEIVATLPSSNLFEGRIVYLTTDDKLYRYTGSAWSRAVDGADLTANSVTTNSIAAGAITAAKIQVTSLSALSANMGTVTAGIVQSSSGGLRLDASNARVLYNTAPGQTGGYVRVQGVGFGPSSNYLDWYGPKPSGQSTDSGIIANLSDATALYFLKTDGSSLETARIRGEFEPKAFARFSDPNGGTLTFKERFNVTAITRLSTGVYDVDHTAQVANINYGVLIIASEGAPFYQALPASSHNWAKTGFRISTFGSGGNPNWPSECCFWVFGSNVVDGSNVTTPSGGTGGGTRGKGNIP